MGKTEDCAFDRIVAGDAPADLVVDEPEVVAFLDTRPVFAGHTLVVPRRHVETVAELDPGVAAQIWDAGARVAAAQRRALGAEGTFFGLNDVVSQSVPHVHLHVVPRRRGDGLRGFFWPRRRYSGSDAEETAAALRSELEPASRPDPRRAVAVRDGVVIRPARPDDAAAVAALLAGGAMTVTEDPADVGSYRRAIAEGGGLLVAEKQGRVVGACQLLFLPHIQHNGGRCAEIESMHVAAGERGGGIGSALLGEAVQRARAAGCYRVQLTSNKSRPDAHRFYLRHGFQASHEGFKLYL